MPYFENYMWRVLCKPICYLGYISTNKGMEMEGVCSPGCCRQFFPCSYTFKLLSGLGLGLFTLLHSQLWYNCWLALQRWCALCFSFAKYLEISIENTLKGQNIICLEAGRQVHHIGKQNKLGVHWKMKMLSGIINMRNNPKKRKAACGLVTTPRDLCSFGHAGKGEGTPSLLEATSTAASLCFQDLLKFP